jgi:hypothetical protein
MKHRWGGFTRAQPAGRATWTRQSPSFLVLQCVASANSRAQIERVAASSESVSSIRNRMDNDIVTELGMGACWVHLGRPPESSANAFFTYSASFMEYVRHIFATFSVTCCGDGRNPRKTF